MTLGSSAWLPGHHRAPLLLSTRDELFSVALGPPPFGAGPCAWPNLAQGLPGPAAEASCWLPAPTDRLTGSALFCGLLAA